ncbi:MAG: ABC transporter substrate-binding protein, partial [Candidatus Parvarchaeota archaeon]
MKKLLIFVLVSAMLILGLSAFGQEFANIFPSVPNVKYGGTLRVVTTWGPVAFNLNPFQPSGQSLGMGPVMYGTLFLVQPYTGAMTPFFGTNYAWSDNNLKLTITIRQGIKWSDGQPFTAQDVAFTFNYLKQYPALDVNGIWSSISNLQSVTASG